MKKNHLIDGTKSKSPEDLGFVESRWDQSVFSILSKKNKFFKLSTSECEWAENGRRRIWYHLENYPIIARRDLKEISLQDSKIDSKELLEDTKIIIV